jgi:KaiC/GvpD/RAD55 family RecA-like ATPase
MSLGLVLLVGFILLATVTPPVRAPPESYSLSATPTRVQEGSTVVLNLNVSNASTFTAYNFAWKVTDPSGTIYTTTTSTNTVFNTAFTVTSRFPQNFPSSATKYVGTYNVMVNQTNPSIKPNIASTSFQVGLTDATSYQRTYSVSIIGSSYVSGERVTINIQQGSTSVSGFPAQGNADTNGIFTYTWQSAPSSSTGTYSVSLLGATTVKSPLDLQTFKLYPTNITISQMTLTRSSLQRTETQYVRLTANYLSGQPVQAGLVPISIVESDSITTHTAVAYYNNSLGLFLASYRVGLNGEIGTWAARIDPYSFNDGYNNGGPSVGTSKGFTVQTASLKVSVSLVNKTYYSNDLFPIYASVIVPDGSSFTSGTVTANITLANNNSQIGKPVSLAYATSQSSWVGSIEINSTTPAGTWQVTVTAKDVYGNNGQGSSVTPVNIGTIPPPSNPGGPSGSFSPGWDIGTFLWIAAVLGTGTLGAGIFLKRFNTTDAPFEQLYSLTGGELVPPTTLMIRGESGAGTTTLGLQLVRNHLVEGRPCVILTYNAFPSELERMMKGMGWKVDEYLKNGQLKFLDCYSALLGGKTTIADPVDFTEVSIQVGSLVGAAKEPVTVLLDSYNPIFNSAQTRHAINFLRILGAKIKNDGGFFIVTGTRGSLSETVESNIESTMDGIIDLSLVRKGKSKIRLLTVKKIMGRQISFSQAEFEIKRGKGILFKKPRIDMERLKNPLNRQSNSEENNKQVEETTPTTTSSSQINPA